MFWPIDQLEPTMRWYREWLPQQPEDVYAFYLTAEVPGPPFPEAIHGEKVCGLIWCYLGPEDRTEDVLQPARDAAEPLFEHVGPMPYPALQSMFDDLYPPGDQWYWKGDFVYDLTDEAIAEHRRFAEVPTAQSTMHMYPINGAVHQVDADETAWATNRGDHRLGPELLGGSPSAFGRGSIYQFHDGRGRRPDSGHLRRQLRALTEHQGRVRSGQLLPRESEHRTVRKVTQPRHDHVRPARLRRRTG